jgi:hypothetical protein
LIWEKHVTGKIRGDEAPLYCRIAFAETDLMHTAEPPKLQMYPEAIRAYKEGLARRR